MKPLIVVTVVAVLFLALVALVLGIVAAVHEDKVAKAYREADVPLGPNNAARPVAPPPQPVERAEDECMRLECHEPWEVVLHGWKVCRSHDTRRPYDQHVDAGSVIEAARQITKDAAS